MVEILRFPEIRVFALLIISNCQNRMWKVKLWKGDKIAIWMCKLRCHNDKMWTVDLNKCINDKTVPFWILHTSWDGNLHIWDNKKFCRKNFDEFKLSVNKFLVKLWNNVGIQLWRKYTKILKLDVLIYLNKTLIIQGWEYCDNIMILLSISK